VRQLNDEQEWERLFSEGDQQRLSLARVLMRRPDTLYLDEATNQLDMVSAREQLEMLRQELPECTLVGVTYQEGLARLFDRTAGLEKLTEPA
jgi:putative ATP-binding cassette transporter